MRRAWTDEVRQRVRAQLADHCGFVLMYAVFAFVVISALVTVGLRIATSERRSAKAFLEGSKSFRTAEAGLDRLLPARFDTLWASLEPGDSLDLGWTPLGSSDSYRGVIRRLDAGGQRLYLLRVTGKGTGLYQSRSDVSLVFTTAGPIPEGIVLGDELQIPGTPRVGPGCLTHTNGDLYVTGTLTTAGAVTASGNAWVSGDIEDPEGDDVDEEKFVDPIALPDLAPGDFCDEADYLIRNGWMITAATNDSSLVGTGAAYFVTSDAVGSYEIEGAISPPGTFCVDGNLRLSGDPGSASAPMRMSLFLEGSLEITGSPFLETDHPDRFLILTEGDLVLRGASSPGGVNFGGLIYAEGECRTSGSPVFDSAITCRGDPNPVGVDDLVGTSTLEGSPTWSVCPAGPPRPIEKRAWTPVY